MRFLGSRKGGLTWTLRLFGVTRANRLRIVKGRGKATLALTPFVRLRTELTKNPRQADVFTTKDSNEQET